MESYAALLKRAIKYPGSLSADDCDRLSDDDVGEVLRRLSDVRARVTERLVAKRIEAARQRMTARLAQGVARV